MASSDLTIRHLRHSAWADYEDRRTAAREAYERAVAEADRLYAEACDEINSLRRDGPGAERAES